MKIVKEQPISGSFVKVWTFQGNVFSQSYRWENNMLLAYSESADNWERALWVSISSDKSDVHYIYEEKLNTKLLAKELAEINNKIEAIAKKHGIEISDL